MILILLYLIIYLFIYLFTYYPQERMTELDSKKLILSKLIEPLNFEESDITK